jgi:hypothetical protein
MEISELIWLNISGTRFCVTSSTLLQYPDTFFHRLLGKATAVGAMRDETGALFVGRPASLFSVVLDFLCTGVVDVPDGVKKERVDAEMEYYGLVQYTAVAHSEKDLDGRLGLAVASHLDVKEQQAQNKYQNFVLLHRAELVILVKDIFARLLLQAEKGEKMIVAVARDIKDIRNSSDRFPDNVLSQLESPCIVQDSAIFVLCRQDLAHVIRFAREEMRLTLKTDSGKWGINLCQEDYRKEYSFRWGGFDHYGCVKEAIVPFLWLKPE